MEGHIVKGLRDAVRFLTVLPTGSAPSEGPGPVTPWFPWVGLLLGLCLLLPEAIVRSALGPSPWPSTSAALTAALWTGLTGGLHEDAWADSADATLAPVSTAAARRILADPHVGAHALSATILVLLVRFSALVPLLGEGWIPLLLPVAPVTGRWVMVLSLRWAPALRSEGLGASLGRHARPGPASVSALVILSGLGLWSGAGARLPLFVGVSAGLFCGIAWAAFMVRRLGGLSGDGHGAAGLAAETAALAAMALVVGRDAG